MSGERRVRRPGHPSSLRQFPRQPSRALSFAPLAGAIADAFASRIRGGRRKIPALATVNSEFWNVLIGNIELPQNALKRSFRESVLP